jgi:LCP family protein required for cell wall assembly
LRVVDDAPQHREPPLVADTVEGVAVTGGGGIPRFSGGPRVQGLWPPDGRPPGPARPFTDAVDDSGGLQFVLILGSDARGGNPSNARSDSIHVLALDPKARRGTVLGIPRDSYVDIPGHGKRKINEAMTLGGPELAVRTVRDLTGMPVTYYLLTAFEGARAIVNDLGGVDAYVPYDMNDRNSGAFFQRGWHRMDGEKALAFSRNRHIPGGDFGRSENQGRLMLDVLKKLRAETGNRGDVERWLQILVRYTRVNMPFSDLLRLGVLARVTADSNVANVVAPGGSGRAGRASVVLLNQHAYDLFRDVAADAIVNGNYGSVGPPPPQGAEAGGGESAPPPEPPPPDSTPEPTPAQSATQPPIINLPGLFPPP